jgi:hypothetical protein
MSPRERRRREADTLDYMRSTRSWAHRLFYETRIRIRRIVS